MSFLTIFSLLCCDCYFLHYTNLAQLHYRLLKASRYRLEALQSRFWDQFYHIAGFSQVFSERFYFPGVFLAMSWCRQFELFHQNIQTVDTFSFQRLTRRLQHRQQPKDLKSTTILKNLPCPKWIALLSPSLHTTGWFYLSIFIVFHDLPEIFMNIYYTIILNLCKSLPVLVKNTKIEVFTILLSFFLQTTVSRLLDTSAEVLTSVRVVHY